MTIYVEDRELRTGSGLTAIDRTLDDPPDVYRQDGGQADADTILDVIDAQAEADPAFAAGDRARARMTPDRTATRIDIRLSSDADQEEAVEATKELADEMPLEATATGQVVVFEEVADATIDAAVTNLLAAVLLTMAILVGSFRWLEGRLVYGLLILAPILGSVALLIALMRFLDEYHDGRGVDEALSVCVRGTGGALTGSMITTTSGLGILYIALGVFYAWLASILVLPSVIVVWDRVQNGRSDWQLTPSRWA